MSIIAVDATSSGTPVSSTTLTWSHICTGNERILFVACGNPSADTITGVTYAGIAMTFLDKQQNGSDRFLYLFYLINPTSGANDIVVTSSASDSLKGGAVSYTGAKQSAVPDAKSKGTSNISASASITGTVVTVADNCWLIMATLMVGSPMSAGANTTQRVDYGSSSSMIFDSNGLKTPPGSFNLKAVNGDSVSRDMAYVIASFAPSTGAHKLTTNSKFW